MDESHTLVLDMQKRFLTDWRERSSTDGAAQDSGFRPMWDAAADLGLVMAIAPDALGGLGNHGDFRFSYFYQRGELLACANFGPMLAGAWSLVANSGQETLAGILGTGEMRPALPTFPEDIGAFPAKRALVGNNTDSGLRLTGRFDIVRGAPFASHLFVPVRMDNGVEPCIALLDASADGVSIAEFDLIDGASAGIVTVTDCLVATERVLVTGSGAETAWSAAQIAMTVAAAAEATGVMQSLLDQTVAYVRQRQQFGVSIGSFQSVQHRLAELLVEIELTHSLALAAARSPSDAFLASAAKARANDALQKVADCAVQFHGGIGTTEELALSGYFRRAFALRAELGTTEQHFQRIEALLNSTLQPAPSLTRSAA